MIQNEHQYKVTQNKFKEAEVTLDELLAQESDFRPRQFTNRKLSLETTIERLKAELNKYESLKSGNAQIRISSLQDLPIALIEARIALGMTQKQLADKIGIHEQQIQRHEANQYGSVAFDRITIVAQALGVRLKETDILIGS